MKQPIVRRHDSLWRERARETACLYSCDLSHKSDPRGTIGTCTTRKGILLLINQLNIPESLRAYGPRFGVNGAFKCTNNHLFHYRISILL